ncbi:MAG: response regulator [Sphingobacteriales bacterium]|nr:MAG: response regulator [Sphingobacteriales bacterium]
MNAFQIVVIHDDLEYNDALISELNIEYPNQEVMLIKKSADGLEYVIKNKGKKMIVILDLNFKKGEPNGLKVLEDIRKHTSLVFVLIWTSSAIQDIDKDDLKSMINNDALGLMSSTDDVSKILSIVSDAAHSLEVRVASALETWITSQPEEEKEKPYITTKDGQTYNLNQILEEVRQQTPFGKETEKNILLLAIDLLVQSNE